MVQCKLDILHLKVFLEPMRFFLPVGFFDFVF